MKTVDLTEVDYLAAAKEHYKNACDYPSDTKHRDNAIIAALIAVAEGLRKE